MLKLLGLVLGFCSLSAFASIGDAFSVKAEHVQRLNTTKTLILDGHASVLQETHKLTADKIVVNSELGTIVATGNCTYQDDKRSLKESEMNFRVEDGKWTLVTEIH